MQKFIDGLKIWAGIFVFLFFASFCTYFVLKARNTSVSWLPTDTTNPWALYVNQNETLTAAKRNTLVAKWAGINMKIYNWTTANADSTTFAHWLDWNKILDVKCNVKHRLQNVFYPMGHYYYREGVHNRFTTFGATDIIINHSFDSVDLVYRNQPYRCVVMYTD